MKTVNIKKTVEFSLNDVFLYISNEPKQRIASSVLNQPLELVDINGEKYTATLVSFIRLGHGPIPELISYASEGVSPEEMFDKLIKRKIDLKHSKVACYVYQRIIN